MPLSYEDIREYDEAGDSAELIVTKLRTDPRTVRDIPVADMAEFLHHTHPLSLINPETGAHYGPLIDIRKSPGSMGKDLVTGIDRLVHHIHQPTAEFVHTATKPDVALLLHAVVARFEELAPEGVDVEAVKADLDKLHGGCRFADVTELDVRAAIAQHEAREDRDRLQLQFASEINERVAPHVTAGDRAAVAAGLRAAADAIEGG